MITKQGQTVNSMQSAPTIIKVANVATMTIKAQISEADVTRVKPGLPVYFTILGEPDERYHATLRAVEPAPDSIQKDETTASLTSASGSATSAAIYYNGLFDVPNPDERLRISMTAQVFIVRGEARTPSWCRPRRWASAARTGATPCAWSARTTRPRSARCASA